MKNIVFALYETGLAGGTRAVFEVANRFSDRGYNVQIIAFGGDHSWFKVKVRDHYIKMPSMILALAPIIKLYKIIKFKSLKRARINYLDIVGIAKAFGLKIDISIVLAEEISRFNPHIAIATYYLTALPVWLSNANKKLYFVQDFPELIKESNDAYRFRLFELTLSIPFHFLANSTYTKNLILSYNKDAKVTVTGVGVDTNTFIRGELRLLILKVSQQLWPLLGAPSLRG